MLPFCVASKVEDRFGVSNVEYIEVDCSLRILMQHRMETAPPSYSNYDTHTHEKHSQWSWNENKVENDTHIPSPSPSLSCLYLLLYTRGERETEYDKEQQVLGRLECREETIDGTTHTHIESG